MICFMCKREFEDGDPVFKIHTYHAFNDTVNGYPEGYIHAPMCPPTEEQLAATRVVEQFFGGKKGTTDGTK